MIETQYATITVNGAKIQFASIAPFPFDFSDRTMTLNTKRSVFPDAAPAATNPPKVQYFGIGINGFYYLSGEQSVLAQPYYPKATNIDLHTPIPFRIVPVDEDLTEEERANYRMRQRLTIEGTDYFAYWLKKIEFAVEAIETFRINRSTGVQTVFIPSQDELDSTPSALNVIQSAEQAEIINTRFGGLIEVTYAEVLEAINVIYGGDLRYAKISEIGLYAGSESLVTGEDGNGDDLEYLESIYTHLFYHRCSMGTSMAEPDALLRTNMVMQDGNLVLRT